MRPHIRHARVEDLPQLAGVENAADQALKDLLHPPRWLPAIDGAARAEAPGFLLVALEPPEGPVIGFAHVLEVDEATHLEQLSVAPEAARRGVGSALLQAVLVAARVRGAHNVTLRTFRDIPFNRPFYERFGFTVTQPSTEMEHRLAETEERTGLTALGARVQMTCVL